MASGLEGFGELAQLLGTLKNPKNTGKVLRAGVRNAMNDVRKRAIALAPIGSVPHAVGKKLRGVQRRTVAPGFGRRSIRVITKIDRGGQMAYALLGVRKDAYYMVQFVELGTSKMAAKPWLRPAFLGSGSAQAKLVGDAINDWIIGLAANHRARGNIGRAQQLESTVFGAGQNIGGSDGTFGAGSNE